MRIISVHVENFRNIAHAKLELAPQATYVVGDNAHGKTNLLEAMYTAGRGASFRTSDRDDLILRGVGKNEGDCNNGGVQNLHDRADAVSAARTAKILIRTTRDSLTDEFAVEITTDRKRLLRNGKPARSPDAHWPHVILFAPEETLLFKLGPQAQRDYFDALCSGLDPSYANMRRRYQRVITQRNRVLKLAEELSAAALDTQLAPWTAQLVELGLALVAARTMWIAKLMEFLPRYFGEFAPHDGDITLTYTPHAARVEDFAALFAKHRAEEIARGITVCGPHRDHFTAHILHANVRSFASQGQHRSVILALKLAEVALARAVRGTPPILLLDDVASELDDTRLAAFFHLLEHIDCQTLVTATNPERYFAHLTQTPLVIEVREGEFTVREKFRPRTTPTYDELLHVTPT